MSITSTHISNFKLRLQILVCSVIVGTALGVWLGHEYVHADMQPNVAQAFHQYTLGRAKEIAGLNKTTGSASSDRHINLVHELRSTQRGVWAQKFEALARQAYVVFPAGGAIGMAVLVMLIGRRIGGVNGRSPA